MLHFFGGDALALQLSRVRASYPAGTRQNFISDSRFDLFTYVILGITINFAFHEEIFAPASLTMMIPLSPMPRKASMPLRVPPQPLCWRQLYNRAAAERPAWQKRLTPISTFAAAPHFGPAGRSVCQQQADSP